MKALIIDAEIHKAIYTGGERLPDIQYVEGWACAHQAGIAVCAVYRDWDGLPMVFGDDPSLPALEACINEADIVVGFNNMSFDNPLLRTSGVNISDAKSFDMLREWQKQTGKRVKLGDLCAANFGTGKSDDGALAPILWQRGERMRVITYCLHDVIGLTLPLWRAVLAGQSLKCPYTGRTVTIQPPALAATAE